MNGVLKNLDQLKQKTEACNRTWKEQEALHQERATRLDEVFRQLEEANTDIAKLTHSRDEGKARVKELTSAPDSGQAAL